MYAITEFAVVVLVAAVMGGFSLVAVGTFLIVMEGFNATLRNLRAR